MECDSSVKDTGCPVDKNETSRTSRLSKLIHSPSLSPITVPNEDVEMVDSNIVIANVDLNAGAGNSSKSVHPKNDLNQSTLKAVKDDLFNDSDFDQILLTCSEKVEANIQNEKNVQKNNSESGKVTVAEDCLHDATKKQTVNTELSFFQNDESIDDILGNIDDSFIMNSLNNSKMMRHKSMPQQGQGSNHNDGTSEKQNRKSFSRHESMPVNQGKQAVQKQMGQGLGNSSESIYSSVSSK